MKVKGLGYTTQCISLPSFAKDALLPTRIAGTSSSLALCSSMPAGQSTARPGADNRR